MQIIALSSFYFSHLVREGSLKISYPTLNDPAESIGSTIIVGQRERKGEKILPTIRLGTIVHAQRINPTDADNHYYSITIKDCGDIPQV